MQLETCLLSRRVKSQLETCLFCRRAKSPALCRLSAPWLLRPPKHSAAHWFPCSSLRVHYVFWALRLYPSQSCLFGPSTPNTLEADDLSFSKTKMLHVGPCNLFSKCPEQSRAALGRKPLLGALIRSQTLPYPLRVGHSQAEHLTPLK